MKKKASKSGKKKPRKMHCRPAKKQLYRCRVGIIFPLEIPAGLHINWRRKSLEIFFVEAGKIQ